MKYVHAHNAFSSGKLSKKLRSRWDTKEYPKGCEELKNMLPMKTGGAARRPGAYDYPFISNYMKGFGYAGSPKAPKAIMPFVFSRTEAYLAVFYGTNDWQIFDVFTHEEQQLDSFPATTVLPTTPEWSYVQVGDILIVFTPAGDNPHIIIQRSIDAVTTFIFDILEFVRYSNLKDPYLTFQGIPYRDANIDPDIVLKASATGGTDGIKNTSGTAVTLTAEDSGASPVDFFSAGHIGTFFRITDPTSQKEGVVEITGYTDASTVTGVIRVNLGAVVVSGGSDDWREASWSTYRGFPRSIVYYNQRVVYGGCAGQPDTVWASDLNNNRFLMADVLKQDISTDISLTEYAGAYVSTRPFNFTIASKEINVINWMNVSDMLIIGTAGTEYVVIKVDGLFDREHLDVRPKTNHGSSQVVSSSLGEEGIGYISRDGRRLREFNYSIDNGKTTDLDLSILSDDILEEGAVFTKLVWQESRSTLWLLSSDYKLYTITLVKEAEVAAWSTHEMADHPTVGQNVHDIAILPSSAGTFDDVYLVVGDTDSAKRVMRIGQDYDNYCADHNIERVLPSSSIVTNRDIEFTYVSTDIPLAPRLTERFPSSHRSGSGLQLGMPVTITGGTLPSGLVLSSVYYVVPVGIDTYEFYTGVYPTGTKVVLGGGGVRVFTARVDQITTYDKVSGFNFAETTLLETYGDATYENEIAVTEQSIEASGNYATIYAGIAYDDILKTMPIEAGAQFGHSTGNITRIDRALLMFYKTQHASFGSEEGSLEDIESDGTISTYDSKVDFPQNPDRRNYLIVKGKGIHLMTLLGATLRGVSYDG